MIIEINVFKFLT